MRWRQVISALDVSRRGGDMAGPGAEPAPNGSPRCLAPVVGSRLCSFCVSNAAVWVAPKSNPYPISCHRQYGWMLPGGVAVMQFLYCLFIFVLKRTSQKVGWDAVRGRQGAVRHMLCMHQAEWRPGCRACSTANGGGWSRPKGGR